MSCFIPAKKQPVVDFSAKYSIGVTFIDAGPLSIGQGYADITDDCRFVVLARSTNSNIILDTETYNCIRTEINGYGSYISTLYHDGDSLFAVGSTDTVYGSPWKGQILKFDLDLNLVQRKVFASDNYAVFFYRVSKYNNQIYVCGDWHFPRSTIFFTIDPNTLLPQETPKTFPEAFYRCYGGPIGDTFLLTEASGSGIFRTDGRKGTIPPARWAIAKNNVLSCRRWFLRDRGYYYKVSPESNATLSRGWHLSYTSNHACSGSYVLKFDKANDFAVKKAVYNPDYDFLGCTDTKFVGYFKPKGYIAIIESSNGIDGLLSLTGFVEKTVTTQHVKLSWTDTPIATRGIHETSDPISIVDHNCIEVTNG